VARDNEGIAGRNLAHFPATAAALLVSMAAAAQGWTLVIHGGAGTITREKLADERAASVREALLASLVAGSAALERGGPALDAVETAVRALEDEPYFNAGRGSVFNAAGRNELDASIMDGSTRAVGAVANVTTTRNPVSLARAVMECSPHVMMIGDGADSFSREIGLEQAERSWFHTEERWQDLQDFLARKQAGSEPEPDTKFGTVGAVARDRKGNLAAATSTGGTTGKLWGRVGDSPIIGAGTFADNRAGAVSATGDGEFYIRAGAAHEICARMRFLGEGPQEAADNVQAEIRELGGTGGVIVVAADGTPAISFNTEGMYRGVARQGFPSEVAIFGDE
jgi:beta-aspartyl-peptidase (threonine type)